MAASRKRAKLGDVLEVSTPRGLAYVQYAGKHSKYGDAIRVLPGFFQVRPQEWGALVAQEGYFTFYPVSAAVSQGLVEVVTGQTLRPEHALPERYRRAGWTTSTGKVTTWFICEGTTKSPRMELSAEERRLFIADIWNHAFLVKRLVEEWHPEQEPPVGAAVESPPPRSTPTRQDASVPSEAAMSGRLSHYFYFPSEKASRDVAAELKKRGFEVENRLGADGVNWLVLASHVLEDPEALLTLRDELEQLALQHSGEYDGWEQATAAAGS